MHALSPGVSTVSDHAQSKLNGANFSYSRLCGSDLRNSDLRACIFQHTELDRADLRNANLTGARFSHTRLKREQLNAALGVNASVQSATVLDTSRLPAFTT